ncbi:uncharacterized protein LOC126880714 [Diabrotica virgifera virgifera]|uniref:Tc1-like transposase DDE domain-containing protein n=1 Tax=Diabrotica virgifera virgifera TaxID=50390 RepID=A0ABM5JS02_DIAVI|nr:uncharacterized protein LOC126880714 [Diabrotica virgifera virgifera]
MTDVAESTIYRFLSERKIQVKDDPDLPNIGRTKLWEVLKELNLRWEKSDRKSVLIDREGIICWRRYYLRSIRKFRAEGRPIYYQDETWVNAGHTLTKIWSDKNILSSRQAFIEGWSTGISPPSGKGSRLIISHIGSEKGFLRDGLLEFQFKSTKDYHEEMTADVFEEYFEQMIEHIPPNSIIVLDNAPYYSRLVERLPMTAWKKQDVLDWLRNKYLPYEDGMVKAELLKIARQHKSKYKKYVVDKMAERRNITVLRLPPYHCEINPIELIWAQMKGYVARKNTSYKIQAVRELLYESLEHITEQNWRDALRHVMEEEQKKWDLDNIIDATVEIQPIIINLQDDSDSEDDPVYF